MADTEYKFYGMNGDKGGGHGTAFLLMQKFKLEFIRAGLAERGVASSVSYSNGCGYAEAVMTLEDAQGKSVGQLKLVEEKTSIPNYNGHAYTYQVFAGAADHGLKRIEMVQLVRERSIPDSAFAAFHDAALALAREHDLLPKVRTAVFGTRRPA